MSRASSSTGQGGVGAGPGPKRPDKARTGRLAGFAGPPLLVFLMLCFLCPPQPPPVWAQKPLVVATSYSPPYSTPAGDGYLDLVIERVFGRLGLSARTRMLDASRALKEANQGLCDGDVGRVLGMEKHYPELVRVPWPVLPSRDFVAISRGLNLVTRDWDSLAPYSLAIIKGWKILEVNTRGFERVVTAASTRQALELLAKNQVQLALTARLDGLAMAKMLGLEDVKVHEPPLARKRMYLYLHKRHQGLCLPLARELEAMGEDGELRRIKRGVLNRYVNF